MSERVVALVAGLAIAASAHANVYPAKPIRLVVGFEAGEPIDAIARVVAQDMSASLGQSVVVENAAEPVAAALEVKGAAPDGYTLLVTGLPHSVQAALRQPYDPVVDFTPVTLLCLLPLLMVTAGDAPFNSVQDVVSAAKARPGEISYASSGHGGPAHLAAVLLEALGRARMAKVRFAGHAPALAEVMAGRVSFMFHPMAGLSEHVEHKRLKVLAAGTEKRQREFPKVPTMAEAGFPGFEHYAEGVGLAAPAGTPTPIVGRLNEAVRASLGKADTRSRFKALGALTEGGSTPEHFAAWLAADRERWQRLVKGAGVERE